MRKSVHRSFTERLHKKQQLNAKQLRLKALRWLATTFPKAFDDTLSIHPLKVGIMQDILVHADRAVAEGISKSKLREALIVFTRKIEYLTCLKTREMRIDLDGQPTTQVSEEEALQAIEKIKKHVEKCARLNRQNMTQPTKIHSKSMAPNKSDFSSGLDDDLSEALFSTSSVRNATVLVKHRAAKTFDPDAVARLKEKLGLSQSEKN
jgi:ProP effector